MAAETEVLSKHVNLCVLYAWWMTYFAVKQADRSILRSNNCSLNVRPKRAHARLSPFVLSSSSSSVVGEPTCNKGGLYVSICCFCCITKSKSLKRDLHSQAHSNGWIRELTLYHVIFYRVLLKCWNKLQWIVHVTTYNCKKIRVNIFDHECIAALRKYKSINRIWNFKDHKIIFNNSIVEMGQFCIYIWTFFEIMY